MRNGPPPTARRLVGRDPLIARVRGHLRPGRLVTLTGTGGVGKTRVAAAIAEEWGGEARFVALGGVRSPSDVPTTVAAHLGVQGAHDAEAALLVALDGRLVVLDELEHLEGFEPTLARWIAARPDLCWLATSRRALQIPEEIEVEVPPLPVPGPEELAGSAAASLFLGAAGVERARDVGAVCGILRLTGGLPLAIELAGARLAVLPLDGLHERLETSYFATLADPLDPERALQSVLAESWAALPPDTQRALAECTVFAGPLTVEAGEAVLSIGAGALDALHRLARWHLVTTHEGRIGLLEPVRRFAAARLDAAERAAAAARHAAWAAGIADAGVAGYRRDPERVSDLEDRAPELRAVLDRAIQGVVGSGHGLAAGRALCVLHDVRGPTDRLLAVGQATLGLDPGDDEAACEAWSDTCARVVRRMAAENDPDALRAAARGVEAADRFGFAPGRARARAALAVAHHRRGDLPPARAALEEALALVGEGNADLRGAVLVDLGLVVHDEMAYAEADAIMEEALGVALAVGDRFLEAQAYGLAATMTVERSDFSTAERWNLKALAAWERVGDVRQHALAVLRGGTIAEGMNDLDLAARRYAEGEVALHRVQARSLVAWSRGARGRIALVRGDLDDAAALLPSWRDAGTHAANYEHVFGAALAAWRGDVATTAAHLAAITDDKAHLLARLVATAVEGFAAEPGSPVAREAARRGRAEWPPDQTYAPLVTQVGDALLAALERHAVGWLFAPDGSWFRPPGGARSDLRRRRAVSRVLAALLKARHEGPLDIGALFGAGWPGERVAASVASNRVYVALSTLRDAGLSPLLVREAHGWRLDPGAAIRVVPMGPDDFSAPDATPAPPSARS